MARHEVRNGPKANAAKCREERAMSLRINQVRKDDYLEATSSYMGWCPICASFTRSCTEPDAEDYDCPDCDGKDVCGAENAMLKGIITVT